MGTVLLIGAGIVITAAILSKVLRKTEKYLPKDAR